MPKSEPFTTLPPPWDRIFSLGTRTFVWCLLIGILYILRPFFLLIFLTFVFAYVQAHMSDGLAHRIKNRPARAVAVFLIFLGAIVGAGYFLGPRLKDQAQTFIQKYPVYVEQVDTAIYKAADRNELLRRLILRETAEKSEKPSDGAPVTTQPAATKAAAQAAAKRPPITEPFIRQMAGHDNMIVVFEKWLKEVLGVSSAFLLSLLFSFLIVLDLPKLTRGVTGLQRTKVGFIYDEVAENIHDFGKVLGRALEAQLFIALMNTILTGIGVYFMGLPNIVFLCTVVFFCSFIPVAGVFLSSVPICLVALQQHGVQMMLIAIGLILLIHFIEAYFLNPQIFGHHMHMNAVLVLIVLTVAGKLFGVWGLVLGLPITNYIFSHAIRYKTRSAAGADVPEEANPAA